MSSLFFFMAVGLFFYWVFKSYSRYQQSGAFTQANRPTAERIAQSELGLFVALMAKVAKADGRVDTLEAELIGNTFTDIASAFAQPQQAREELKAIFNREKDRRFNIDEIALQLQQATRRQPRERLGMYAFLVNLAYIDGVLTHAEESLLTKIAAFLQIDPQQAHAIMEQFASLYRAGPTRQSLDDAYALLGVSAQDPLETVKKKYRALVKQYHPDLMKAKGADEAYIAEATKKMQEINAAYEMVKEAAGRGRG